jgi:anti-sigma factor RsiW
MKLKCVMTLHDDAPLRYVTGAMLASERDLFEEHFFGCPACAERVCLTAAIVKLAANA